MKRHWINIFSIVGLFVGILFIPLSVLAKDTYPKLANYYLKYYSNLRSEDYEMLKKWDLLITQNDINLSNPNFILDYKIAKPDGIILAYIYSAMAIPVPQGLYNDIERSNLWLRDRLGNKLEIWPNVYASNLSKDIWQNMNVEYVARKYQESSWDGIMYDVVDSSINHFSRNGIDITGDGQVDDSSTVNSAWQQGMVSLFSKTRASFPDKLILMNGNSIESYQTNVNGRIFENFPTPWEGNGTWQANMYQYLVRLPGKNKKPTIYILNGSTRNTGQMNDYRNFRFGLTSALLGDGYFSFDFGDQKHEQNWWYDEYDIALGQSETSYFNLLEPNNFFVKPGLWRRDFENGVSIVNSTTKPQLYIFKHEQFEKIKGTQDRNTNDGSKVNYIRLNSNDGIVMRKVSQDIFASPFFNGNFVRVFNMNGTQARNGFFAYRADLAPNALLVYDDLNNDGVRDRISEQNGNLLVVRSGKTAIRISPFGTSFKGKLTFAVYDFNKDGTKEIVVAPASGGGPNIRVYAADGKLLSGGFFAFDKNFRGGVALSVGDLNNDGQAEIVVAPGKGMPPTIKMFNEKGKLLGSFLAYDKNFRGGVNIVVGDADNDGKMDLVTGAASGGPHLRIFDYVGHLKSQFMAFDPKLGTGISVMIADTDGDSKNEILAGTANF